MAIPRNRHIRIGRCRVERLADHQYSLGDGPNRPLSTNCTSAVIVTSPVMRFHAKVHCVNGTPNVRSAPCDAVSARLENHRTVLGSHAEIAVILEDTGLGGDCQCRSENACDKDQKRHGEEAWMYTTPVRSIPHEIVIAIVFLAGCATAWMDAQEPASKAKQKSIEIDRARGCAAHASGKRRIQSKLDELDGLIRDLRAKPRLWR